MNYSMIFFVLQLLLQFEAAFLVPPLLISAFSGETEAAIGFLITIALLLPFCIPWRRRRRRRRGGFSTRESFVIVGISWILMSVFGALPFVFSGEIPSFIDAFFETVSGFTTTGASILTDVEAMSRGLLFWRSFTHWIGGMGVLVFLLAVIPMSDHSGGTAMHLLRAESPGPQVDKIRPKMLDSAKILYKIYIVLTVVQVILLLCGGLDLFESVCTAMGTAGTGGFGVRGDSLASYSPYLQWVVKDFKLLFSLNFNVYALLLARRWREAATGEEVRVYLLLFLAAAAAITVNLIASGTAPAGEAVRAAAFQTASIMSTTGFVTTDFNLWPQFSRTVLVLLTVVGACAGSTGGGFKVSRVLLLIKAARNYLRRTLHPRQVRLVRLEGNVVEEETVQGVFIYLILYVLVLVTGVLLVSLDGFSFETNATAVLTCLNNVGPGLDMVGPAGNFAAFSGGSKLVLSLLMLVGRLEILPVLMLFSPNLWKKK